MSTERLKSQLATYIIERIHSNGGQFLERFDGGWKVIHDPIIKRNKITQAFRVRNRTATKKNQGLHVQQPRYGDDS